MSFQEIIDQIPNNQDNPNWLADAALTLARLLYTHNHNMGLVELAEHQEIVSCFTIASPEGKKMSVAEAEKRAIVNTNNVYNTMRLEYEAIKEIINSLKKKIEVLSWEREPTKME